MRSRVPTLRTILSAVTVSVTILALGIAVSLVVVTGSLHRTSNTLAAAIETFRVADEAEVDLLLHGRAHDPLVRRDIEGTIRNTFAEARRFVTTDAEAKILDQAATSVEAYIELSHSSAEGGETERRALDAAYLALERLGETNLRQARLARESADRSHSFAKVIGIGVGLWIVALSGWLLWWLRVRAFRPILALATAFERFARGERDARADADGPAELRDMAQRFNDMAAALASQRQAQLSFLGGVAHDLRTPISAVTLALAPFRPDGPLPPEPKIRRTIDVVRRQTARLERMTRDFLDIARIEAGALDLQPQWNDGRKLVSDVRELFESATTLHPLVVTVPPDEVPLWCDPLRIEQVLTNLISNAIKYSPRPDVVRIGLELQGDDAVLSVCDRGIGISAEDQRRLFEPFRRVGLSKEAIPGVGLGLFVVRQIVLVHGGRIEVTSALGQGTTVRVFLPLTPRAPAVEAARVPAPPPPPTPDLH